jgi:hypothetical protein
LDNVADVFRISMTAYGGFRSSTSRRQGDR